jgi:hypothetical protein
MAISLYDISVGSYLQIVGAFEGVLSKGLEHFKANGIDPNEIVESRMIADMLPFKFQVAAVAQHSLGAVKGIQSLTSDPVGDEIRANERRVASAMKTQNMAAWQQLPVQMAYQRAEDASDAQRAAIAADLNSRNAYMQALFGAAMNPGRSYTDPAAAQLMASALSSGIAR